VTPQEIAEKSAEIMWAEDIAAQVHGMQLESIGPGAATLSMATTRAMTNGHGAVHGGFIFLLADAAFAYACNSYNQRCVAQQCSIAYLKPGREGSRLTARAREVRRVERSGVYDVSVADETGAAIAEFRGLSRSVAGAFF
jgi:acyl-CoA thioesterase